MTKEQRDAVRKGLRPIPDNDNLIWLLDAADRADRLAKLLREAKPKVRPPTDQCDCANCRRLERLHDAIDAELGATR